jgi:hypothetical protein
MTAVIEKVRFNEGLRFTPVELRDYSTPTVNWKYASLDHVIRHPSTNKTIIQIVEQCPLKLQHKRILIDIKVQHLTPDITSCIPGWHLDGPGNPLHPSKPELHHLYIHEEGGETEFIADQFELELDDQMQHNEIVKMIPPNVGITKTKAMNFATFTRFDFHRGIKVKKSMTRLLVRLTETDIILPNNKPYKNAVGTKSFVDKQ